MIELISAIEAAYNNPENEAFTTKAHRLFLSHQFIMPIQKDIEEPTVLYLNDNGKPFIPFFSSEALFEQWAGDLLEEMTFLTIMGKDVILGTSDTAYLCLDIGNPHYKEFAPSEIQKLRQIVLKLEKIITASTSST